MSKRVWRARLAATLVLTLLLICGCGEAELTAEGEQRALLPQLIQITIIPEPTATPETLPAGTLAALEPAATAPATTPTPAPTKEPIHLAPARVTAVEVLYGEGFPVPVTLRVHGIYDDLCSEIGRTVQARTPTGLAVGLYAARPVDRACPPNETEFTIEVPLDISELDVGNYTVTVNGVAATLDLQLGMIETHNPDLLCATAAEGQQQARIERSDEAYCFLYPSDYGLAEDDSGVIVSARQRSDVPVPLIGEVRVASLGSAGGLTPREWAEQDLADKMQDIAADAWSEATFAGQEAVVVVPIPGDEPTRQVYLVHDAVAYRITFAPHLPPGAGEQADLARQLFDLVGASFVFYR